MVISRPPEFEWSSEPRGRPPTHDTAAGHLAGGAEAASDVAGSLVRCSRRPRPHHGRAGAAHSAASHVDRARRRGEAERGEHQRGRHPPAPVEQRPWPPTPGRRSVATTAAPERAGAPTRRRGPPRSSSQAGSGRGRRRRPRPRRGAAAPPRGTGPAPRSAAGLGASGGDAEARRPPPAATSSCSDGVATMSRAVSRRSRPDGHPLDDRGRVGRACRRSPPTIVSRRPASATSATRARHAAQASRWASTEAALVSSSAPAAYRATSRGSACHSSGHVNAPPAQQLARIIRVFTVPVGMPSSRPASRVVRPSSTVAWTTARSSGDSRSARRRGRRARRRAAPAPRPTARSAWASSRCERRRAAPELVDQPADGDAPHPGGHLARALVAGGLAPDGDERVLQRLVDHVGIGAAPGQAGQEPGRVAAVELGQRAPVVGGQGAEQLGVAPSSPDPPPAGILTFPLSHHRPLAVHLNQSSERIGARRPKGR